MSAPSALAHRGFNPTTFTGQSVVITGAAGGIGTALTQRFLARGARVFAVDRQADALDRLRDKVGAPGSLFTATLDISDEAGCQTCTDRVHAEWGTVDVLVNGAGYFPLTPFEELTYARWREIMAINLDGPFLVTRALLPPLKTSRAGRIVIISSGIIFAGTPDQCPYVTAMDAFEEQTRQKAPSWSAFDIRMMFQGYLERGFVAGEGDLETLTALLGHPLRRYEDFARETAEKWQKELPWPLNKLAASLR